MSVSWMRIWRDLCCYNFLIFKIWDIWAKGYPFYIKCFQIALLVQLQNYNSATQTVLFALRRQISCDLRTMTVLMHTEIRSFNVIVTVMIFHLHTLSVVKYTRMQFIAELTIFMSQSWLQDSVISRVSFLRMSFKPFLADEFRALNRRLV